MAYMTKTESESRMHAPVTDTCVELLEFPEAHDVILVFVKRAEHAVSLFVREIKLSFEHRYGLISLETSHVVLNVSVKYLLNFLPV